MRGPLAPLLVSALVLGGCATTRAPVSTASGQNKSALFEKTVALVETATVASLTEASGILATGDAGSAPDAPALRAVAGRIFAGLYPELPSPFADVPTQPDPSWVSAFLGKVMPALERLGPDAADALNHASVLPPWLQARLDQARGSARGKVRPLLEDALRRDPGFYPAARALSALIVADGAAALELPLLERLAVVMPTPRCVSSCVRAATGTN